MTDRCVACGPIEGKKHDSDCPFQKYETIDLVRGLWFKCLGDCGGLIGFYPVGVPHPRHPLPPGACAHSKPKENVGIPHSTGCTLYNTLDCVSLWAIHRLCKLETQPDRFDPMEN
jgi:hypothetical protein